MKGFRTRLNVTFCKKKQLFIVLFTFVMVVFLELLLVSTKASAENDSIVDNINITVPVSCTMSGTGMQSHNAEITNGTYTSEIGTTTLHAFCNDNEGFAIYAAGYTGNEIGATNSNKLVGASTNETIITGTATSAGNPDISNWAMKLAITQDSGDTTGTNALAIDNGFNAYHIVPNEYTKVAHKNSATDMTATTGGVKLTTTYAAYISKAQPADTYSGQVIYTLVHPTNEIPAQPQHTQSGKICYYSNSATAEGTMGCQDIDSSTTSITLLASNYSRTGYGFAGWSDVFDYATNTNAKFYGPQEDITFSAGQYTGNNDGLSLYAVWVSSQGSLQDVSKVSSLCGSGGLTAAPVNGNTTLSSVSALTDLRDNQTYAIAKLSDGRCWMIENLRLETDNSVGNSNMALSQGYDSSEIYGNFVGLAEAEFANFANSTTANSLYYSGSQSGTASVNIGTTNYPGYRMARYNNINTVVRASNPNSNTFPNDTTTHGMYSYGNYYTWPAAIASSSYREDNNVSSSSTSICPKGWRLPIGGNKANQANNEFWDLVVVHLNNGILPGNYSSNNYPYYSGASESEPIIKALRTFPNNFVYAGYMTASAYYRGSYGRYWTSTNSTNAGSYYLGFASADVTPASDYTQKYRGYSIRCVAE